MTLFDTRAKIYTMTRKVIKDVRLAIRQSFRFMLVSHINHNWPFLDLYKDMKVVVSGLKIRHPIFIVEYGDHDLVLG